MSRHSRRAGEPYLEWGARWTINFIIFILESAFIYLLGPLFKGIGQMIVFTAKTIINHTSKYVIMAVVALAFVTALVWMWQMDFDFILFIETIKSLWA